MYSLKANKTDTLVSSITNSDSSFTITNGAFGTMTGTQLLVIDYDNSNYEIISCTIGGVNITGVSRGVDNTTAVAHAAGAKIGMMMVPSHYTDLGKIAAGDPWTSNVPTWAATSGTAVSLGNGTIIGRYQKIGSTADFTFTLTMGSSTTYGDGGTWTISLPYTVGGATNQNYIGSGRIYDSSANTNYPIDIRVTQGAATLEMQSHGGVGNVSRLVPITFDSGDVIMGSVRFEVA